MSEERPVEWPPPQASRDQRRACAKHRHDGMIKAGYCVQCGTKVSG